jgi:hypothetical protein
MKGCIRCEACRFVRVDRQASRFGWTAYKCGNRDSEYFGALLNVTPHGGGRDGIIWEGCGDGRAKNDSVEVHQ